MAPRNTRCRLSISHSSTCCNRGRSLWKKRFATLPIRMNSRCVCQAFSRRNRPSAWKASAKMKAPDRIMNSSRRSSSCEKETAAKRRKRHKNKIRQQINMPQKMPVVRQVHWVQLIPQAVAIAGVALMIQAFLPRLGFFRASFIAALAYLLFCRVMRSWLTRDHILGMKAYQAQHFDEAILHFDNSHQFFSAHR